jgi:hypothetical protein
MTRGRKAEPCPDQHELRVAWAFDPRLGVVARQMDANPKQVRRWLGEIGIMLPAPKKIRERGSNRFCKIAYVADGRRVWTKLYGVWNAMRGRCNSPGTKDYKRYGARGIRVCVEWNDYANFRAWALEHGFKKGLTLDRTDTNGNYEQGNCRWIPKGEQQENIRRAIKLTLNGETRSLYRWARVVGISADLLRARHYEGWTDEQVLTTPLLASGQYRQGVQHKPRGRKPRIAQQFSESGSVER